MSSHVRSRDIAELDREVHTLPQGRAHFWLIQHLGGLAEQAATGSVRMASSSADLPRAFPSSANQSSTCLLDQRTHISHGSSPDSRAQRWRFATLLGLCGHQDCYTHSHPSHSFRGCFGNSWQKEQKCCWSSHIGLAVPGVLTS